MVLFQGMFQTRNYRIDDDYRQAFQIALMGKTPVFMDKYGNLTPLTSI